MFFDDGLAGAEGYDEHVQGLDIHQLGLVNGISDHMIFESQPKTLQVQLDTSCPRHYTRSAARPNSYHGQDIGVGAHIYQLPMKNDRIFHWLSLYTQEERQ